MPSSIFWFARQASKVSSVKPACLAIASSGSSGFCTTQSFCCWNSVSIIGKYLSLSGAARQHEGGGGQRVEREFAEDEAHLAGVDVALLELRDRSCSWNVAQCGQVIEAYSMMVTGAFVLAERLLAERARGHQLGVGGAGQRAPARRCRVADAGPGSRR